MWYNFFVVRSMFTSMILSKVKKELENTQFRYVDDIMLVKVYDDEYVLRLYKEDKSYVLRYRENGFDKEFLCKYSLLGKYGINTVNYIVENNNMIIFEDVCDVNGYRSANKDDLNNFKIVESLAIWYKKLHSLSVDYCSCYVDYFTKENIEMIMNNLNFKKDKTIRYIYDNFDNIKLKQSRLNKSLLYGSFCLENLVVFDASLDVFMVDFDGVCFGNPYSDLKSVFEVLSEDGRKVFMDTYGDIKEDEIIIDYVVSNVEKLYLASKDSVFPDWAKDSLATVVDGTLLEYAKNLVEWY